MNQSFQKFARLSVVAAAVIAAPAFAATSVDANAEFDTGVQSGDVKASNGSFQGGRIEINFAGRAEMNGGFVAGRGTVIAGNAGNQAGVDDAWVQAGTSAFDVKLGRFEASDLYATPGDVFRIGGAGLTSTNLLRGRTTYTGAAGTNDRLHMALTANLAPGMSLEIGLVDAKDVTTTGKGGAKGVRPTLGFSSGALSGRVGFESGKLGESATKEISFTNVGATVSFNLGGGMALRANLGNSTVKATAGDIKVSGMLLGFDMGGLNISVESGKRTQTGTADVKTSGLFAAYAMPLFGIKGATFQPAIGTGTDDNGTKTTVTKVGARVHYDF